VGKEAPLLLLHVLLVLDGGEDGRVRRGTADALLLQLLDQRCLGEARRRLREVLLGDELDQLQLLAGFERGQLAGDVALLLVVAFHLLGACLLGRLLRLLAVDGEVAGNLRIWPVARNVALPAWMSAVVWSNTAGTIWQAMKRFQISS